MSYKDIQNIVDILSISLKKDLKERNDNFIVKIMEYTVYSGSLLLISFLLALYHLSYLAFILFSIYLSTGIFIWTN